MEDPGKERLNLRFGLLQAFIWSAFCVLFSFFVPLLRLWGYDPFLIGVVTTLVSLSNMVTQPFWGIASEGRSGIRRLLLLMMAVSCLLVAILPLGERSIAIAIPLAVLLAILVQPLPGLLDIWIVRLAGEDAPVVYSVTRGGGSFGFAFTAFGFGILLDRFGPMVRLPAFVLLMAVSALLVATTREPLHIPPRPETEALPHPLKALATDRRFLGFLLSVVLVFVGNGAMLTFYPVLLTQLGGTNAHLGIGLFILAMSEFPAMIFFAAISRRLGGSRRTLLLSLLFFGVKNTALALSPSLPWALGLQVLQAISFGLYLPAAMQYMVSTVDRRLVPTAQMVHASVAFGLGSILGSFIGGLLIGPLGVQATLVVLNGVGVLGFVLFAALQSSAVEKHCIRALEKTEP